jgi:hypothetical protein
MHWHLFVELLIASPLQLNPLFSVALIWFFAYLPHGLRGGKVITELECTKGRELDMANFRALTERTSAENAFVGVLTDGLPYQWTGGILCVLLRYNRHVVVCRFGQAVSAAWVRRNLCVSAHIAYTRVYLSLWSGLIPTAVYSMGFFYILCP